jgi:hypothetical protein
VRGGFYSFKIRIPTAADNYRKNKHFGAPQFYGRPEPPNSAAKSSKPLPVAVILHYEPLALFFIARIT